MEPIDWNEVVKKSYDEFCEELGKCPFPKGRRFPPWDELEEEVKNAWVTAFEERLAAMPGEEDIITKSPPAKVVGMVKVEPLEDGTMPEGVTASGEEAVNRHDCGSTSSALLLSTSQHDGNYMETIINPASVALIRKVSGNLDADGKVVENSSKVVLTSGHEYYSTMRVEELGAKLFG